jgi:hypothetical protein
MFVYSIFSGKIRLRDACRLPNHGRKEYYSLCPWKTVRFDDENKCGKVFDGIDGNLDPNSSDGKEVFDGRFKSFWGAVI